ncbi:ribbon-helix-helix protein, CopG family [Paraburkholderia lycopersici]|uniref:Ribbon-helix-helix protein, copG family n=1 Tax=Paraburkholderia lycopersici TaxID=416944 RepID=A0A1G7CQW8_9BURK|nr:ribbon-helix-helix protein, CopG family [Paraburkholderia lycopersici]SDE41160.1 Ribbon-helix-helix protein, copG family [Paraburkholderia lycopersici]
MGITKRPTPTKADPAAIEKFINSAPDAKGQGAAALAAPAPVAAPTTTKPVRVVSASTRKHPISLTIDAGILARMDEAAAARGLSRAAAIADACADWLKSKEGA